MKTLLTLAIALSAVLSACATSPHQPVVGVLYSDVQNAQSVTSNQVGNREGKACAKSYLGAIATGDASVETARKNGGVTLITSVDAYTKNYFVFYSEHCTVVRGR